MDGDVDKFVATRCRGGQRRWGTKVATASGPPVRQPEDNPCEYRKVRGCDAMLDDHGDHRAACSGVLGGHWKALHDQFQDGLHRMLQRLPGVTSCIDKTQIPTHVGLLACYTGRQISTTSDIYLRPRLPDHGHLASLCGSQELVIDVTRVHTHTKHGEEESATGPRHTCGRVLMTRMVSTRNHTNAFTLPFSPWSATRRAIFTRLPSACFITSKPFKPPVTSTTQRRLTRQIVEKSRGLRPSPSGTSTDLRRRAASPSVIPEVSCRR